MDKVREVAKKLAQFDNYKLEELIPEHEIAYLERATAIAEFLKSEWQPIETALLNVFMDLSL